MDKFSTKIISIENDSNNSRIQRDKTKDRRNATRRSFKCKRKEIVRTIDKNRLNDRLLIQLH